MKNYTNKSNKIRWILFAIVGVFSFNISFSQATEQDVGSEYRKNSWGNTTEDSLLNFIESKDEKGYKGHSLNEYINFYIQKSLSFNEEKNKIKMAKIYYYLAKLLKNNNQQYDAYRYADKTSTLLDEDQLKSIGIYGKLMLLKGNLYFSFGRIAQSKNSIRSALSFNHITERQRIDAYNTLGLIFRDMDKADSSVYNFEKALNIAKNTNNKDWIGVITGNIGYAYYKMGNIEKAKKYLERDSHLSLLNGENASALNAMSVLMEIALDNKDKQYVDAHLSSWDSLATAVNNYSSKQSYFRVKTKYYEDKGNYKEALDAYRKSVFYHDSLEIEYNQLDFQNMEFQINYEKKKAETSLLRERNRQNRFLFVGISLLLFTFLCGAVFSIYQLNKRKKKNIKS